MSERLPNIHPGEILLEEFMKPLDLTPYRVAKCMGITQSQLERILDGKQAVTPDRAIRLGKLFGTTAQFWLNLQSRYDLEEIARAEPDAYAHIQPISLQAA
jgi:antitoxin HigA-1